MLIPKDNEKDLAEVHDEVKEGLEIVRSTRSMRSCRMCSRNLRPASGATTCENLRFPRARQLNRLATTLPAIERPTWRQPKTFRS